MNRAICGLVALAALSCGGGCSGPALEVRSLEHLSPVYTVDREYRSMKGPSSTQAISFPESDFPELLWITGYRAEMVDAGGKNPMPQEYMCHSNLDFDSARHAELHGLPLYHTDRLFTLSQGQLEIELPRGFGLPYFSDEPLSLVTQVLNLNPDDATRQVRHKVTIEYVRDRDLRQPMRPLFMTSGWGPPYDTTRFLHVRPGAYVQTGFRFDRTGPPLTAEQKRAIRPMEAEISDLEHERGVVSMPIDAQTAFSIFLGYRPGFDERHVVIGQVTDGFETLAKMTEVPRDEKDEPLERIAILSAEVVGAE